MQRSSHYYRRSSNHGSSSAFSPNANPNEDWTKISDLAERRRIQNRIAQRNYRKKLKRRLEDLEKRAASGSMSPDEAIEPRTRSKPATTAAGRKNTRTNRSNASNNSSSISSTSSINASTITASTPIKTEPTDPYSYYQSPSTTPAERPLPFEPSLAEDGQIMFDSHCTRQLSASPPPVLSFSTYPSLNVYGQPIFGSSSSSSSSLYPPPSSFSATVTTPSSFSDAHPFSTPAGDYSTATSVKRYSGDEGILSPFNMSYASMDGIGLEPEYHHSHSHHHPHHHAHVSHAAAAHHPHHNPHHHAHSHQPQLLSHLSVLPALGQGHGDDRSMSTPSTPAEMPLVHPLTPESDPCSPRSFPLF